MTRTASPRDEDRGADGRRVHRCPQPLRPFVDAGVLASSDVHVAATLCRLLGADGDLELLGAAFAARAPRVGHSCLDVDVVAEAIVDELSGRADDGATPADRVGELPWPDTAAWLTALAAGPLTGVDASPLVIEGRQVFLRRQLEQELEVAADLRRRTTIATGAVDHDRLEALLARLFPDAAGTDPQRLAAHTAATRNLTVVAGGPGTGKTWTVSRILAVLVDQAAAVGDQLRIGLVAPTGKAAARLDQGIRSALAAMDVPADVRDAVAAVERGQTIHRLLGRRTGSRFWHDRDRPLPHDVVVVDETSMASLALTAHLLEAVRPDARVVLVGDPDQLASVEAGSVLADVVAGGGAAGGIVTLTRPHRFGADSGIGRLARSVRDGDPDAALAALEAHDDLDWVDAAAADDDDLAAVRRALVDRGARLRAAAETGQVDPARAAMEELVVLCAHRRGRDGVAGWNDRVDRWLTDAVPGWRPYDPWQPGRTVLATANDRQLQVFNGDLGVMVSTPEGARIAFEAGTDEARLVPPTRLAAGEPVHALTIHKSQGSQWSHVVVVLPEVGSRIVTRQLLYTAVTRAADRLTIVGDEAVLRAAIARPIRRASGLARRLTVDASGSNR
jgi:exodeoxyribonuclease V alpha subunit